MTTPSLRPTLPGRWYTMKCYHCASVHPELVAVLPEFARGYAAQSFVGHGAQFAPGVRGFTVDGRPGFGRLATLDAEQDRRPDRGGVRLAVRSRGGLGRPGSVRLGRAVPPGQGAGFDACERCQRSMASRGYAAGGVLVPPSTTWPASTTGCGKWLVRRPIPSLSDKRDGPLTNYE
jgi:Rieske 2Fe-2S family protein